MFISSFAFFAYGSGPPTIAGNGTITTNMLPLPFNFICLGLATISLTALLSYQVFKIQLSEIVRWKRAVCRLFILSLSAFVATQIVFGLWIAVYILLALI